MNEISDDQETYQDDNKKIQVKKFANLKGTVMGYLENNYTRPITSATVFIKIHIMNEQGKEEIYNLTKKEDIIKLSKEFPEVYQVIAEHHQAFEAKQVNEKGIFSINELPVSWWCYIIGAYVQQKEYDITQHLGNNGFDQNKEIKGEDLEKKQNLEGIIVPVKDEWYKDKTPEPKNDDPPTDPMTVPPGRQA